MLTEHLQALGLDAEPFEAGPAGRFFFTTPALTQRLDLLHHLVEYSDLLLTVIGPEGSGRTSVLAKIIEGAREHWRVCPISVVGTIGVNALLDRVMAGLDVPGRGQPGASVEERLTRLAEHLEAMANDGSLAAIVIDDADRLDDDAVEFVIELALRSPNLKARVILAGPAAMGARLQEAAGREVAGDLIHSVELPALNEEQTADYLNSRLGVAGLQGDTPFAPERAAVIRKESKGRPAAINELATTELAALAAQRQQQARRGRVNGLLMQWWKGLAVIAVALAMIALAIVIIPSQAPRQGPGAPPPQIVDQPKTNVPPVVSTDRPEAAGSDEEATVIEIRGDPVPTSSLSPERTASAPPPVSSPPPSGRAGADSPSPSPSMSLPTGLPTGLPNDGAPVAAGPAASSTEVGSGAGAQAVPESRPSAPAPGESTPPLPRPRPATAPTHPKAPATSAPGQVKTLSWLRAQNPNHFTIQLMGTHNREAMSKFIADNQIGASGAWFRSIHQGRRWYVLVYGAYATRAAAARAADRLPARVKPGRPWIRTFASILATVR